MILEIFTAAVHSVGTAMTMTAAGIYLHRRGMITSDTKTGMARYTQQIAIPALFFTKIVDCPQDFSQDQCPNILDHLGDAWVLLIWPFYVLGVGLLVGKLMIYLVQPPQWQNNCILAATAFANAMGMPITLLEVIGHNFQPPGGAYNATLDPSMFQSIYVILNPVLQWGLGGWLLSSEDEVPAEDKTGPLNESDIEEDHFVPIHDHQFIPIRITGKTFSAISLEDAGYETETSPLNTRKYNGMGHPIAENVTLEEDGLISSDISSDEEDDSTYGLSWKVDLEGKPPSPPTTPSTTNASYNCKDASQPAKEGHGNWWRVTKKIASKAMAPPALGALAGFVVASYSPLRGLFVDLHHRADNAPLEWIFDGILALAKSAIPVNMCVVGVNLNIASQRRGTCSTKNADGKTIAAVVLGKMLVMPLVGIVTVWFLKTFVWNIPEEIQFQFYLVLLMNFVTPTANVVMVIAELGSGPDSKNVMASLIGWQYVVAPVLLSLTVMMIVYTAVL
mgnify:CR=1 FL=1